MLERAATSSDYGAPVEPLPRLAREGSPEGSTVGKALLAAPERLVTDAGTGRLVGLLAVLGFLAVAGVVLRFARPHGG